MQIRRHTFQTLLVSFMFCVGCSSDIDERTKIYLEKQGSYPVRTHHLSDSGEPLFINRLIQQSSLYLLQHAHNPVDWWAWGDDAFARARELDKPVLLSIGYSTCHWCHVMERESFEDIEIANFINQNFIAIKVDREEHPDIDELYLTAVQMLSGKAGWPLTAVLTPEGVPFFGGTYFPPDQFLNLLTKVNDTWVQNRDAIVEQAARINDALEKINQSTGASNAINEEVIALAQQRILTSFNVEPNGNGPAFPREPEMLFLLHRAINTLDSPLQLGAQQRLTSLMAGGIHDQLGGGFHRYSVDSSWQVPHFEKMLYNQAQIIQASALAYWLSGDDQFRSVAESTLAFMLEDMQAPSGGFYSAMDAESDGQEGGYYIWSFDELQSLLNAEELELVQTFFGVSKNGNFVGSNVLRQTKLIDKEVADAQYLSAVKGLKNKLISVRNTREAPSVDTKTITAWNAMVISALTTAYQVLGNQEYLQVAIKTANLLWNKSYSDKNNLLTRTANLDSEGVEGVLEDYAYLANAMLDLHVQTNDEKWLVKAEVLVAIMIERFYDADRHGFLVSRNEGQRSLFVALLTARDDAINSGNSMAAQVLARLYRRTGTIEYRDLVRNVLSAFSKQLISNPQSLSGMLNAVSLLSEGEIISPKYAAKGKIRIDSKLQTSEQLLVTIDIEPGWHINSYRVLEKELIPSRLSAVTSACATIGSVTYPKDELVSLGFQKDELLVYADQIKLLAEVSHVPDSNCQLVAAELHIQACSDEVCLSPEVVQIRGSLVSF